MEYLMNAVEQGRELTIQFLEQQCIERIKLPGQEEMVTSMAQIILGLSGVAYTKGLYALRLLNAIDAEQKNRAFREEGSDCGGVRQVLLTAVLNALTSVVSTIDPEYEQFAICIAKAQFQKTEAEQNARKELENYLRSFRNSIYIEHLELILRNVPKQPQLYPLAMAAAHAYINTAPARFFGRFKSTSG